MRKLLWALASQDGAVANARSASTALSGRRVEREEVELFLERLESRSARRRVGLRDRGLLDDALLDDSLPDAAGDAGPR